MDEALEAKPSCPPITEACQGPTERTFEPGLTFQSLIHRCHSFPLINRLKNICLLNLTQRKCFQTQRFRTRLNFWGIFISVENYLCRREIKDLCLGQKLQRLVDYSVDRKQFLVTNLIVVFSKGKMINLLWFHFLKYDNLRFYLFTFRRFSWTKAA